MGGFVGMRLAARKPNLLKSLTLMDTSADEEPNIIKYKILNLIFSVAGSKPIIDRIMSIMFGQTFLHDSNRAEERLKWRNHIIQLKRTITRSVEGVITRKSVFEELKSITIPTLVLVGDEDVATVPEKSKRIHKQINGSVLEIIPGAGHSSSIEQPEHINQVLTSFINSHPG
jgi:pimeloyl-ACP methyl ester carboxylesterase